MLKIEFNAGFEGHRFGHLHRHHGHFGHNHHHGHHGHHRQGVEVIIDK